MYLSALHRLTEAVCHGSCQVCGWHRLLLLFLSCVVWGLLFTGLFVLEPKRTKKVLAQFLQDKSHEGPWNITVQKKQHGLSGRERALAAVGYWKYKHGDRMVQNDERLKALLALLMTLSSYPVEVDVLLVTNAGVREAQGLVSTQVLREHPSCKPLLQEHTCMPWEAVAALRKAALTGSVGADSFNVSGPMLADLTYDYYMYFEADLLLPTDAFRFWRDHADDLYKRGHLLLPHRREPRKSTVVLTDWQKPNKGCSRNNTALLDTVGTTKYDDLRDSVYIQHGCTYTAAFLMTRMQFRDYLKAGHWDYDRSPSFGWMHRERAAAGLLVRERMGYGRREVLTHERLYIWHELPAQTYIPPGYTIAHLDQLVLSCVRSPKSCDSF
mmetsp:Transcript_46601/g.110819  ORF Transcript_46601/g.110819 Transcript_46601/m.110819 type:complete len:383 (+) Transcript_46601:24-1172(+)